MAQFNGLIGVASDATGNLFVIDANNVVRKISSTGQVTTLAGLPMSQGIGSQDGIGTNARFSENCLVTTVPNGDPIVADYDNRTIRKITVGGIVTTLAGAVGESAYVDGPANTARFRGPWTLTADHRKYFCI